MRTIYAIPGLGTTKELFSLLKLKDAELKVLTWPTPLKGMSMKIYAEKFLEQINTNEKFYLLGMSFGGMLSSELADILKPEKTIFISTCKTKNELPFLIKALKFIPIHQIFSEKFLRKIAFHSRWLLGFKKEYENLFKEMLNSMPTNYLKNSIDIIVRWDKITMPKNYVHIHGDADRLLLLKNVKADYAIHNGTHAMIVYQADEISELLNRIID